MLSQKKFALLHAFFKADCKGGGEKTSLLIRNHYKADLYTGFVGRETWKPESPDPFSQMLYDKDYQLTVFHEESKIPYWRKVKRQLAFFFNSHRLNGYDVVIFGGNIGLAAGRITEKKTKKVLYCYTPPRPFTDQLESRLQEMRFWLRPLMNLFAKWVRYQYKKDTLRMDLVIADSQNVQKRLKKFFNIDSRVIYPPVETGKFTWLGQKDYFLSYARLEPLKRIPLLLDAFEKMPEKKLVICSSGPLKNWLEKEISKRKLNNVVYEGLVSDTRLKELVGNCLAGIYIPVDEDAGIIQCELMAAGKPVIGVDEGGLKETVVHEETGLLIKSNPSDKDLIKAIQELTSAKALSMKEKCIKKAKIYDIKSFFQQMDEAIEELYNKDK
jgi:glycosyltransferase involved in cell wall biosynthesis